MTQRDTDFDRVKTEVRRLTEPDLLGFYTHFEATEIFVVRDVDRVPCNVITVLVAEDRSAVGAGPSKYLGNRIRLRSLGGWAFGIKRSYIPVTALEPALNHFYNACEWRISGEQLQVGALTPVPTQFVPPDSTTIVPWNNVLKNNFWNGSHIIELMDSEKTVLQPLFDDPPRLQELSEAIQKQLPIRLASLSDQLGNVVVQLPVTIFIAKFGQKRATGETTIAIRWHPKATARPLRASCEMQFDNVITTYASASIQAAEGLLPTADTQGLQHCALWDDQRQIILAANGGTSFLTTIGLNMHVADPEPRVFTLRKVDGSEQEIRVGLSNSIESVVKAPGPDRGERWTRSRIYSDEAARLAATRRFVQYKPVPGQQDSTHELALRDIRLLLNQYGKDGAWLWDPYLSADDVLRTLFYSPHKAADLRAMTAGYQRPSTLRARPTLASIGRQLLEWAMQHSVYGRPPQLTFAERQRAVFDGAKSNLRGLRIEYRMKTGPAGWAFHDRFLIFPKTAENAARTWSLGTSVNSLGRQHHILQQVDDGQLVADAFQELWDQLGQPEHLVWKTP